MDEEEEDGQNIISIPKTEMSTALKEATQSVPIKASTVTKWCDARDRYIVFLGGKGHSAKLWASSLSFRVKLKQVIAMLTIFSVKNKTGLYVILQTSLPKSLFRGIVVHFLGSRGIFRWSIVPHLIHLSV